jgi:ribosome-dependent ATPase
MDDGKVLATGTPAELLQRTGTTLEEAFIALLPEEKARHQPVVIPPLRRRGRHRHRGAGLTMRFGDFVAVDHVSFRIRAARSSASSAPTAAASPPR